MASYKATKLENKKDKENKNEGLIIT